MIEKMAEKTGRMQERESWEISTKQRLSALSLQNCQMLILWYRQCRADDPGRDQSHSLGSALFLHVEREEGPSFVL